MEFNSEFEEVVEDNAGMLGLVIAIGASKQRQAQLDFLRDSARRDERERVVSDYLFWAAQEVERINDAYPNTPAQCFYDILMLDYSFRKSRLSVSDFRPLDWKTLFVNTSRDIQALKNHGLNVIPSKDSDEAIQAFNTYVLDLQEEAKKLKKTSETNNFIIEICQALFVIAGSVIVIWLIFHFGSE